MNCGYHVVGGVHGVRLLVQSEKDPLYLEYVIRKFWEENAREYLNELTDEKCGRVLNLKKNEKSVEKS